MTLTGDTLVAVSPMLMGVAAAVAALLLDAVDRRRAAIVVAALLLAAASAMGASVAVDMTQQVVLDGVLVVGEWASWASALVFGLAALVLAGDMDHLSLTRRGGGVAALYCLAAVASSVLAAATDLIMFVIALETVAVCSYALVASAGTRASREASMKYVVQGAAVTGILLYAAATLFGEFGGGSSFMDLVMPLSQAADVGEGALYGPAVLVVLGLVIALGYKLSAFPLHFWAPDAFESAPPGAGAFMASAPKAAALFFATVAVGQLLGAYREQWSALFAVLAVGSIAYGNLSGLKQVSFTRMLAYSGIAQAGYALSGLAVMASGLQADSLGAFPVRVFAVTYSLGAVGAFLGARALRDYDPDWDGTIVGMAGLASRRPWLAAGLAVCLLSLTGIPLTAGFWGKFWVFLDVVRNGWTALAVVGFIGSVVSFGYYGSVMRAMYLDFGKPVEVGDVSQDGDDSSEAEVTGGAGERRRPAVSSAARACVLAAALVLIAGVTPLVTGMDAFLRALI